MEKNLIPELRFPEFREKWEVKKLSDVVDFFKGKGISKSYLSDKGIQCILYGQLYTKYSEVIFKVDSYTNIHRDKLFFSKFGDVLIPSSGETALDMSLASALLLDNIALGGDINVMRPKTKCLNSMFLSYQINSKRKMDIAKIAEGASVVHLYNKNLKDLKISTPIIDEQNKISEFFLLLDEKIDLQKNHVDRLKVKKKGLMQRIFSREVRFKDEDGNDYPEWEEKKLDHVFNTIPAKKYQILAGEIQAKGKHPVVTQSQDLIEGYTNNTQKLYTDTPIVLFGDHTTTIKFIDFECVFGGDGVKLLTSKKTDFSIQYLYYALQYVNVEQDGYKRHFSALREQQIPLPSFVEQEKISNILSKFDEKISLEENLLKKYEDLKKGLMQKMFV